MNETNKVGLSASIKVREMKHYDEPFDVFLDRLEQTVINIAKEKRRAEREKRRAENEEKINSILNQNK